MKNPSARRAAIASLILACSAAAAYAMTPRIKLAQLNGGLDLESVIPKTFGEWQLINTGTAGVVNPQTEELLKATYNQILTRTYINPQGLRVMLSIAYGEDQTDSGSEVHHPEVCYPAQGFQLVDQSFATLHTKHGDLRVKRLNTRMGSNRAEPVTYWIVVGHEIALTATEKRMAELRHSLKGQIVDGLLFRISTIDTSTDRAYAHQDQFAKDLLTAVGPIHRQRLAGLN